MLIKNLIKAIEQTADPALQEDWDQSGLQVASVRTEAFHAAVMLDATPGAIQAALKAGADFLLSHHPLALKPALPNRLDAWHKALRLLLRADAPLYAAHTSLDANLAGPAGWLGDALQLNNKRPLEKTGCQENTGFGQVGDLPEPVNPQKLLGRILQLCGLRTAALAGPKLPQAIGRIAYCGGSGASMLHIAQAVGAELYVTGDVKYHAALEAEIPVLDVGHHSLEEEMMRQFARQLADMLPEIEVTFFPSASPFQIVKA